MADDTPSAKYGLTLLGRFELAGSGGIVSLPGGKLAGLLAYLACTAPRPQSREKLTTLLWGSHFDAQAKQNLRQALARLRRILGDALETDAEAVWLRAAAIDCDVSRFEALVRDGSRDALSAAADLYHGRLIDDITIREEVWSEWVAAKRERLSELALGALVRLGEHELAAGRADEALQAGRRAIALNNMREDGHRLVLRGLTGIGRKAEALKHYQDFAALLKRELNAEPDGATRSLVAELRRIREIAGSAKAQEDGPLPAATVRQASSERRQLTIVVCDVVEPIALSARLDPEDMHALIGSFHKAVADAVARFGGFVAQYSSDGVLVYFGYPIAREHDAERAVRAALAVRDAVGNLTSTAEPTLLTRIGIATGLVVVGEQMVAGTRQPIAIGEAPSLAARLQVMASPGEIVIGSRTRLLVGQIFQCQSLPAVDKSGASVEAWQVLGESTGISRFEALRGRALSPLVGRHEEMDLLLRRWRQVQGGEGQVVLVSGEPGIGKSRIVEGLRVGLENERPICIRYFCSPHNVNSPLHPVIEQLEVASRFEVGDGPVTKLEKLEALLKSMSKNLPHDVALVAELLGLPLRNPHPVLAASPQQKRELLLTALVDQIAGLAAQGPVLIVLEDAHWVDPTTLDLADRMVARAAHLKVLLVGTFRPEFQPPWVGQPHVTVLALNRLGRRDSARIMADVAGDKGMPNAVVEHVLAQTDGVPLFVEELTRTLLESGLLREAEDGYVLDGPLSALAIPTTLQASLVARFDQLGPGKDAAMIGAVIGRDFSHELIAAVADLAPYDLDAALERLMGSGLISRRGMPPAATYTFKHALVQDAAYATMLRNRRRQLHSSVAKMLIERFAALAERQPEIVAHHFTEAGLAQEAIGYWFKAGRLAYPRAANREAMRFLEQALQLLDPLPESRETLEQGIDIRVELGNALYSLNERQRMGEHFDKAEALARKLGDQPRLARVLAWLSNQWMALGAYDKAFSATQEATTIARTLGDRPLVMSATIYAAFLHLVKGELSEAASVIERADIREDEDLKPGDLVMRSAYLKVIFADVLSRLGRFDEALRHVEAALQAAEVAGHGLTLSFALFDLGRAHLRRGNLAPAIQVLERCLEHRRVRGQEVGMTLAAVHLGVAYAFAGRTEEALPLIADALKEFRGRPRHAWPAVEFLSAARVCLLAGRIDEAAGHAREALNLGRRLGAGAAEAEALLLCGDVASARGDEEASVYYREGLALAEKIGARPLVAHCHLGLGSVLGRAGESVLGQEHVAAAAAMYHDMGITHWLQGARVSGAGSAPTRPEAD